VTTKGGGKGKGKPPNGGKGKGTGKGAHWVGYPKSEKGSGRSPSTRRTGQSPSGRKDAESCRAYFTPEGCPYGKNGKEKCRFWHPGYCTYFQDNKCPLSQALCPFLHKKRPVAQARVALTDEQKSEKKAEKKKAKKERKDNPSPAVPVSPGPKARAKSKGKHQLRIMLEGDSETKDTANWEDETHVYAFVEADMV